MYTKPALNPLGRLANSRVRPRALIAAGMAAVSIAGLFVVGSASASPYAQPPTVSIATVTGTPTGPVVVVPDQVNVRTGPNTEYELIGVLIAGQTAACNRAHLRRGLDSNRVMQAYLTI